MIPFIKTDYSVGKSIIQLTGKKFEESFDTVISIAEENKFSRVYMVEDHIGGFIPIYKELEKKGISLCYGWRVDFVEDISIKEEQPTHKLVIFIKNEEAYKKLIPLISLSQTDGSVKGRGARLDFHNLHKYWSPEMILAIPFYDSFLAQNLLTKNVCIPDFRGIHPYVFIESNDLPFDDLLNTAATEYAKDNDFSVVKCKTIYYNKRRDIKAFQVKKLMNRKSYGSNTLDEPNLDYFCSDEFCIESWKECAQEPEGKFEREFDTALTLFLPGVRLPKFTLSKERQDRYKLTETSTADEILRAVAREGMLGKIQQGLIPKDKIKEYGERAKYELDVLIETRLAPYIVLVWDVTDFIEQKNYPRSPGRGSAAGSLVNWLIGITGRQLDPFIYDLYFERFISLSRSGFIEKDGATYLTGSLADIDLDTGSEERHLVFEYVQRQYPKRTCKVATLGTLTTKRLVTEVCKIYLNFDPDQAKLVSDLIPLKFNQPLSIKDSYQESEDFKKFCDEHPEFLEICFKLHDSIISFGKHASAVLLSHDELDEFMPLQLDSDGEIISSYDQNTVNEMAIKLDLLGLSQASVVHNICGSVGINPDEIPLDSKEFIYDPVQNLEDPYGLFQMGEAVQIATRQMKPTNLEELSDCLAIGRPGAAQFIPKYVKGKNGEIESLHPLFDPLLKKTANTILYQEQTLRCLNEIGFSLKEADDARRAIGKKKREEMDLWEEKIYKKAEENNIDPRAAKILWDVCNASADYSFNKSLCPNTEVRTENGYCAAKDIQKGDRVLAFNTQTREDHFVSVLDVDWHEAISWDIWFDNGTKIRCSMNHKFLNENLEMIPLKDIITRGDSVINRYGNCKPIKWEEIGREMCLDLEVDNEDHNFYANGLVVSNSHSVAYSILSCQTIYLKYKYPQEFFLESLKVEKNKSDFYEKVAQIITELPHFSIKLLPPSIAKSGLDFTLENGNIRFGLSCVKGASAAAAVKIQKFLNLDRNNKFQVFNAAKTSKVDARIFSALSSVGGFDEYGKDRHQITLEYRIWCLFTDRERSYCLSNGKKYNYELISALQDYNNWISSDGKKLTKESRLETIREKSRPYFQLYKENSKLPEISSYLFEKELLGFSFSYTLSSLFKEHGRLQKINQILELPERSPVKHVGHIIDISIGVAKSGKKKVRILSGDETGTTTFLMVGDKAEYYLSTLDNPKKDLTEGMIVLLTGTKGIGDLVWCDQISVQELSIYSRVNDLKKIKDIEITD